MGSIRDIKRNMRAGSHRNWAIPALYIAVPGATPISIEVRVWRKRGDPAIGDTPGSQTNAQMLVSEDRIRFQLSTTLPVVRRLAIVSVEAGEAYRIDHLYPADDGYQTARVIPLPVAETVGLPVPVSA